MTPLVDRGGRCRCWLVVRGGPNRGNMRYKLLGTSGLRVSEVALGTVNFGANVGDWTIEQSEAGAIFDAFVEAGGNFFDCGDTYVKGRSEEILGELIHADRDQFVVATKYGEPRVEKRVALTGSSRRNMRISVENSLRPSQHRLHRYLLPPLVGLHHWMGGDLVRDGRPGSIRQSAIRRNVERSRMADQPRSDDC
jgi:hypothetical protein